MMHAVEGRDAHSHDPPPPPPPPRPVLPVPVLCCDDVDVVLLDAAVAVDAHVEAVGTRIMHPPCIGGWIEDMKVMASIPARACLIPSITIILSLLSPTAPPSPTDSSHEPRLLIALVSPSTSSRLPPPSPAPAASPSLSSPGTLGLARSLSLGPSFMSYPLGPSFMSYPLVAPPDDSPPTPSPWASWYPRAGGEAGKE